MLGWEMRPRCRGRDQEVGILVCHYQALHMWQGPKGWGSFLTYSSSLLCLEVTESVREAACSFSKHRSHACHASQCFAKCRYTVWWARVVDKAETGLESRLGPRTFGLGLSAVTQIPHFLPPWGCQDGQQREPESSVPRHPAWWFWVPLAAWPVPLYFAPAHVLRLAVLIHNYVSKDQYSLHRMNSKSWGSTTNLARAECFQLQSTCWHPREGEN